jgi:hypothetical protein
MIKSFHRLESNSDVPRFILSQAATQRPKAESALAGQYFITTSIFTADCVAHAMANQMLDAVVIGAGLAGLGVSDVLKRKGLSHCLLERRWSTTVPVLGT